MQAVLRKQIEEMTEDGIKEVFYRDYLRKLTRYQMTDDFYKKRYNMNFESFEKENIVMKHGYTFEVESDAQEWELAIDGIKTVKRKLKELSGYKDDMQTGKFVDRHFGHKALHYGHYLL